MKKDPLKLPLKAAFLHSTVMIPGVMSEMESLVPEKLNGTKLFLTPQGLRLETKEKGKLGNVGIVPFANVKIMYPQDSGNGDDEGPEAA